MGVVVYQVVANMWMERNGFPGGYTKNTTKKKEKIVNITHKLSIVSIPQIFLQQVLPQVPSIIFVYAERACTFKTLLFSVREFYKKLVVTAAIWWHRLLW